VTNPGRRAASRTLGCRSQNGCVDHGLFIVVDGLPASGKSTLAPELAESFHLPLLAKDTIKDAIMAVLPPADVEGSRQLGRAAVDVMLALAAASPVGAVLESNLYRTRAAAELGRLPGLVVEVFCRCERDVARHRYRLRSGTRAAGHFDALRTDDELWNDEIAEPVAGGWPVVEVDTNVPADLVTVVAAVSAAISAYGKAEQPRGSPGHPRWYRV
jgi:predicted kinase